MRSKARRIEEEVAVRVHPPERRRRLANVAACGCCCCCCCLHSLGGLIGSTIAGRPRSEEERTATIAYWLCLAGLLAATFVWASLAGVEAMEALLIVSLLVPGYQIATSVLAGIISRLVAGPAALPRIWRITWRGIAGGLIGLGAMLLPFFVLHDGYPAALITAAGLIALLGFLAALKIRSRRVPT